MDIKVKDLIKILCDFNPNADVKVIYNNEALKLFGDVSWNWGDDDSPVKNNNLAEVKCVSLWALDEKQAQELEEETRRRFTEAPCKPNNYQTKDGCYGIRINITQE